VLAAALNPEWWTRLARYAQNPQGPGALRHAPSVSRRAPPEPCGLVSNQRAAAEFSVFFRYSTGAPGAARRKPVCRGVTRRHVSRER
jgi:hypothetical protein